MNVKYMHYTKAAPIVGLTVHALYEGIRNGTYPAVRVGGKRGRWYVNVEKLEATIDALMKKNIKALMDEELMENFFGGNVKRVR